MAEGSPSADPSGPCSPGEWFEWLSSAQEALFQEYLLRGGRRLVSDYRHERSVVRGYVGREILELLQNAGDQAADAGIEGDVAIHLSRDGLVVANKGTPFSPEGVDSLQTANLSPKKGRRRAVIGEKGLGFRAVLNWTDSPLIVSGGLRLVFSRRYASGVFAKLVDSSEKFAQRIEKERRSDDDVILPTLAFPAFDQKGELDGWFDTPEQATVAARCAAVRVEGYDTAIGMPFRTSEDFEVAKRQIDELRPEILLFVDSLSRILIKIEPGGAPRVWWRESAGQDSYQVLENGELLGTWKIHASGVQPIPEEHRDEIEKEDQCYEVIVATTDVPSEEGIPLFSYFPTEVTVPHPVVCHATLQLDESRKHPVEGKANRYILVKLAETIAEVAEKRTTEEDPWAGLRLLRRSGEYPTDLKRVEFAETLRAAAAEKKLIPSLDGKFRRAGEALLLEGATSDWIPARIFPELVRFPNNQNEWSLFSDLKTPHLDADEFAKRLSVQTLGADERVALIAGIVRSGLPERFHCPELLLDSSGGHVEARSRVFLPPRGRIQDLPEWVELRFMNRELRERLQESLGKTNQEDLQQCLSGFGVRKFDQASMLQSVVAEANRRCGESPEEETAVRNELLRFLFGFFCSALGADEDLAKFPQEAGMRLLTQSGTYEPARNLYLARGYGVPGAINQGLYEAWAPRKLVSSRHELSIEGSEEELAAFLQWLGVAEFPREERKYLHEPAFRDILVSALEYPARFDDYLFNSSQEVAGISIDECLVIADLDGILESASPVAILGWLAADHRWIDWRQRHSSHCRLIARKGHDRNDREYLGPVPSHISWKISTTEWLPTSTGDSRAPSDCLIASKHIEVLFPRPADFPEEKKLSFGLNSMNDICRAWERAGVLPGLERLELDQIYGLLLCMPEKSRDGRAARALARWLLENTDVVFGGRGPTTLSLPRKVRCGAPKVGERAIFLSPSCGIEIRSPSQRRFLINLRLSIYRPGWAQRGSENSSTSRASVTPLFRNR